jgi:hypothetical protein
MNKRFFMIITSTIAMLVCNYTFVFCGSSNVVAEILKMQESGFSEETILMYLQSQNVEVELTSQDLVRLKNAGFSEGFIQALLQLTKIPEYDMAPQMYDYGSAYFSYSFGFNYGCFPSACNSSPCKIWGRFGTTKVTSAVDSKRYFYSGGHAYIRHNGHFHNDDEHRFQSVANINQLPENTFISQRFAPIKLGDASFKAVSSKNHWSGNSWLAAQSVKNNRPAGSFHAVRSRKTGNKIGFGGSKSVNKGSGRMGFSQSKSAASSHR